MLDGAPDIILDNGADLVAGLVARGTTGTVIGGTEETTSGGDRLRTELAGAVPFPVIVINDSLLKAIGENKHAVGQSAVESFMRITNAMVPGRRFVVFGYGWCGRGVAHYLRALGGKVAVVDTDELKAFEAALDGFRVGSATDNFAPWGDVFITATGRPGVLPYDDHRADARRCDHRQRRTLPLGDRRRDAACQRATSTTLARLRSRPHRPPARRACDPAGERAHVQPRGR